MHIAGATALVTGATGGLGEAIARGLAAAGATVLVSGRRTEVLEALVPALGPGARAIPADLADPDAVDALVAACGDVDLYVANAALPASGPIEAWDTAGLDRAIAVNLRAPVVMARALLDGMRARGRGHVVFVSSLAGKAASPGGSVYSATKFGLRGFALGMREDLAGSGVSASVISPGFISGAGMFHDSGMQLPFYVGTKSPGDVTRAVVRAVEEDVAEIDVAPLFMRLGAAVYGLAPGFASSAQRRLGGAAISNRLDAGHRAAGKGS